ncbi:ABC transporter substrate-binding protein [Streptomyces violarus]|uniref:ABC transporter substrate-binding protein n=1 Tax=Streptomyces violarus TaxID=67380 RepID=UPI0021BFE630|nr:ABC transporter substrate-binding protein [Streptomyces violarus]MCT9141070.1 ABC transporter substrate-binding protein [Streptomyces violarus]
MSKPIRVETDLIPSGLYGAADDWTGLTITRQLARPLFVEGPDRTLRPGLLHHALRLDEKRWDFALRPGAQWSDGRPIHARDIARHIAAVAKQAGPFAWLVSLIEQIQPLDPDRLLLTTRHPVGNLPALLANPVFGPRHSDPAVTSGAYTPADGPPGEIRLRATGPWPDVTYVLSSGAEHGQRLYDRRAVDITCPTTFPVPRWANRADYPDLQVDDLDIAVALLPPSSMAAEHKRAVAAALDRRDLSRRLHGALSPLDSFTGLWDPHRPITPARAAHGPFPAAGRTPVRLVFPDFSPNRETARILADQLGENTGLTLRPEAIDYRAYLTELHTTHREDFRLVLMASPWPDPVALLLPFTRRPAHRLPGGPAAEFKDIVHRALAADDLQDRLGHCAQAEQLLSATGEVCLFGRLRSAARLRVKNYVSPPSGWADLSVCEPPQD